VMHEPALLILDEPFSGFDPVNAELIKNEILELNRKGTTIIFSTHRMESVEELCDSIALLNLSHKILDGKVKQIKNTFRNRTYLLEYEGAGVAPGNDAPFEVMENTSLEDHRRLTLRIPEGGKPNDVLQYMLPLATITRFEEIVPGMNEIFISTVNKVDKK
jgi:ABC-2 type transport system ATP-binding protein